MVLRIDTGGEFVVRGVGDPTGILDASNMRYTDAADTALDLAKQNNVVLWLATDAADAFILGDVVYDADGFLFRNITGTNILATAPEDDETNWLPIGGGTGVEVFTDTTQATAITEGDIVDGTVWYNSDDDTVKYYKVDTVTTLQDALTADQIADIDRIDMIEAAKQNLIVAYDTDGTYAIGDIVFTADGEIFRNSTGTNDPDTAPALDTTNWSLIGGGAADVQFINRADSFDITVHGVTTTHHNNTTVVQTEDFAQHIDVTFTVDPDTAYGLQDQLFASYSIGLSETDSQGESTLAVVFAVNVDVPVVGDYVSFVAQGVTPLADGSNSIVIVRAYQVRHLSSTRREFYFTLTATERTTWITAFGMADTNPLLPSQLTYERSAIDAYATTRDTATHGIQLVPDLFDNDGNELRASDFVLADDPHPLSRRSTWTPEPAARLGWESSITGVEAALTGTIDEFIEITASSSGNLFTIVNVPEAVYQDWISSDISTDAGWLLLSPQTGNINANIYVQVDAGSANTPDAIGGVRQVQALIARSLSVDVNADGTHSALRSNTATAADYPVQDFLIYEIVDVRDVEDIDTVLTNSINNAANLLEHLDADDVSTVSTSDFAVSTPRIVASFITPAGSTTTDIHEVDLNYRIGNGGFPAATNTGFIISVTRSTVSNTTDPVTAQGDGVQTRVLFSNEFLRFNVFGLAANTTFYIWAAQNDVNTITASFTGFLNATRNYVETPEMEADLNTRYLAGTAGIGLHLGDLVDVTADAESIAEPMSPIDTANSLILSRANVANLYALELESENFYGTVTNTLSVVVDAQDDFDFATLGIGSKIHVPAGDTDNPADADHDYFTLTQDIQALPTTRIGENFGDGVLPPSDTFTIDIPTEFQPVTEVTAVEMTINTVTGLIPAFTLNEGAQTITLVFDNITTLDVPVNDILVDFVYTNEYLLLGIPTQSQQDAIRAFPGVVTFRDTVGSSFDAIHFRYDNLTAIQLGADSIFALEPGLGYELPAGHFWEAESYPTESNSVFPRSEFEAEILERREEEILLQSEIDSNSHRLTSLESHLSDDAATVTISNYESTNRSGAGTVNPIQGRDARVVEIGDIAGVFDETTAGGSGIDPAVILNVGGIFRFHISGVLFHTAPDQSTQTATFSLWRDLTVDEEVDTGEIRTVTVTRSVPLAAEDNTFVNFDIEFDLAIEAGTYFWQLGAATDADLSDLDNVGIDIRLDDFTWATSNVVGAFVSSDVRANPTDATTDVLSSIFIDGTNFSVAEDVTVSNGTAVADQYVSGASVTDNAITLTRADLPVNVVANPGTPTDELTTISIAGVNYRLDDQAFSELIAVNYAFETVLTEQEESGVEYAIEDVAPDPATGNFIMTLTVNPETALTADVTTDDDGQVLSQAYIGFYAEGASTEDALEADALATISSVLEVAGLATVLALLTPAAYTAFQNAFGPGSIVGTRREYPANALDSALFIRTDTERSQADRELLDENGEVIHGGPIELDELPVHGGTVGQILSTTATPNEWEIVGLPIDTTTIPTGLSVSDTRIPSSGLLSNLFTEFRDTKLDNIIDLDNDGPFTSIDSIPENQFAIENGDLFENIGTDPIALVGLSGLATNTSFRRIGHADATINDLADLRVAATAPAVIASTPITDLMGIPDVPTTGTTALQLVYVAEPTPFYNWIDATAGGDITTTIVILSQQADWATVDTTYGDFDYRGQVRSASNVTNDGIVWQQRVRRLNRLTAEGLFSPWVDATANTEAQARADVAAIVASQAAVEALSYS